MLSKVPPPLLGSPAGRAVAAAAALPAAQLLRQLRARGFAAQGDKGTVHPLSAPYDSQKEAQKPLEGEDGPGSSTYARFKDVASQSGNPVKEWIQGSKEHASAYGQSAEQVYEAVKRSTQDATTDAKEAARSAMHKAGAGGDIMGGMAAAASQAAGAVGSKLSEASQKAAAAVQESVGDDRSLPSARAEFEKSRSEGQKAETNKDRKSQLTDEAVGDNPAEQRTRDEHEILPNEFYTKH
ncbi:hypothetical protein CHLNCDRAFT_137391 [Chlorella variabilis]|uniref:Uncharacterized protein n=1 Tax=Chlorella variabilis TaxID=554065 RepID=E1ZMC0_CHLVA|nr:hypothetical protein CHLNCDRAFT_137391 [Chlorella variabilis]EFN52980.1 hypothetical protein CHLNCDRAFT_137391 [Chlorella variabilis]|eukprot:XP_005845082.1 hypothetical protein CHLNCDRAFT_137391 [Chlorella variabilis]